MRERKNKKRIDRYRAIWHNGYINWTIGRKKMIRMVSRKEAIEKIVSFFVDLGIGPMIPDYKHMLRFGYRGYDSFSNFELEQEWDSCYSEKVRICD